MLKPRFPQSPSPPQSRVRIGEHVVDLSAREVTEAATGQRTRITSKAQAVITELAVNPGQVLSRDDLMDRVWTGAFPTGDVLTQAITALRKAFGDDAEAPRYIETISKSGYRLIAPVQWLPNETRSNLSLAPALDGAASVALDAAVGAGQMHSRPATGKFWLVGLALTVALLALGFQWRSQAPSATVSVASAGSADTPTVIVASLGDDWGARLSPDGAMIVFVSSQVRQADARLFLQSAMVATPTPLTHPGIGERDLLPTWSPDGRHIAFQRHSDQAACKMMLVPASGGAPKQLGLCPANIVLLYDWSPDGKHLVMGGTHDPNTDAFPIHKFDLASGLWSPLDYSTRVGYLDLEPRYSPDGRWLAFRRNLSAADLWRMPSGGGEPERLTHTASDIRGYDWAPDSRHIVYSSHDERGLSLFSMDTHTGSITPLGIEATFPDFPLRGEGLVFEIQHSQLSLTKLNLAGTPVTPERILGSSGNELNAEISPDKNSVAFTSDRSGTTRVWLAPVGNEIGAAQQVEGFMPVTRFNPVWSPDSQQFLVIGFGATGAGLYEVDRDSLRVTHLKASFGAPRFADYLDDGELLVGSIVNEQQSMWVVERNGNNLKPLRQMEDVTFARVEQSSDRIFFVRIGQAGLWVTDRSLKSPKSVFASTPKINEYKMWTFSDQRLVIAGFNSRLKQYGLMGWPVEHIVGDPEHWRELTEFEAVSIGSFLPGQLVLSEAHGNGRDVGLLRYPPHTVDR